MDPIWKTFDKNTRPDIDGMINVNARFPTQLTAAILPLLLRYNGPSLIMNIGSLADAGTPWSSTYGGARSFNMAWSKGLGIDEGRG